MMLFHTQKPTKLPQSSNAPRLSRPLSASFAILRGNGDLLPRKGPYIHSRSLSSPNIVVSRPRTPQRPLDLTGQGAEYTDGNIYMYGLQGEVSQGDSLHSQQGKSWTRGLFRAATISREREENAMTMMIDLVTDAAPDDWNLVLKVCEHASANESAARDAARALRHKFKYGQSPAQLRAVRLWAIMLQKTTGSFVLQTATRKFLETVENTITSEIISPVVRERLLNVLAFAAYIHGKKPGKEGFGSTWRKVRPSGKPAEGIPFNQEDRLFESEFPRQFDPEAGVDVPGTDITQGMEIDAARISLQQSPPHQQPNTSYRDEIVSLTRNDQDRDRDVHLTQLTQQRAYEESPPPGRASLDPDVPGNNDREIIPTEEDMLRLMQDCYLARSNAQVLSQALAFATADMLWKDPVIQEFHTKCQNSKELIVAQIPWASAAAWRVASDSINNRNVTVNLAENKHSTPSQNGSVILSPPTCVTKEEKLLAALLLADQELVEVIRIYDELERLAFDEMVFDEIEGREAANSSNSETLDRTEVRSISPNESLLMELPGSQGASSSHSASPVNSTSSLGPASVMSIPSVFVSPASPSISEKQRGDLWRPPNPSTDQFSMSLNNPSIPPPYSLHSQSYSQQHSGSVRPLVPQSQQQQQQQKPRLGTTTPQIYQEYLASNESFSDDGRITPNLPLAALQGLRLSKGPADNLHLHTPSLDVQGDFTPSHTSPTIAQTLTITEPMEYTSLPLPSQEFSGEEYNELAPIVVVGESFPTTLLVVNQELVSALPRVGEEVTSVYISETRGAHRTTTVDNRRDKDEYKTDAEVKRMANHGLAIPPTNQVENLHSLEMLMKARIPEDLTGQVNVVNHNDPAQGGYADVFAGLMGDKRVAVKKFRIRKSHRSDPDLEASNERRIHREMRVWAALEHPNISEFLGYATEFSDYPAMISTWCQHGTVSQYLDQKELSVDHRLKLSLDVGNGLQYLHKLKLIHGDLKPSNVLVDGDFVARLCDFGLVRMVEWDGPAGMTTTSPYTGTERYKAPELFVSAKNRRPIATFEGDIYSLGCVLLEIVERHYPFQRFIRTHELRDAILDGHPPALRTESSEPLLEATEHLWNLLESCWTEPSSRPDVHKVVDTLEYFARVASGSSE